MPSSCLKWLIVTGGMRSGTTVLRDLLMEHPQIALFHEYGGGTFLRQVDAFFDRERLVERELQFEESKASAASDLEKPDDEIGAFYFERDRRAAVFKAPPIPRRREHFEAISRGIFSAVYPGRELTVVGDKRPIMENWEDLDDVQSRVQKLLCIAILRAPLATVNSSLVRRNKASSGVEQWHVSDVRGAVGDWARAWDAVGELRRLLGDGLMVVKYEDLCAHRDQIMSQVCNFLGVDGFKFETPVEEMKSRRDGFCEDEEGIVWASLGMIEDLWENMPIDQVIEYFPTSGVYYPFAVELPLKSGGMGSHSLREGFSQPEQWGVWTDGARARMAIVHDETKADIEFTIHINNVTRYEHGLTVAVLANRVLLGTLAFTPEATARNVKLFIPNAALRADRLLEIEYVLLRQGEKRSDVDKGDTRDLGIGLSSVRLDELVPARRLPRPA